MAVYRTKKKTLSSALEVTPRRVKRSPKIVYSPQEIHARLSYHYRLTSENCVMNCQQADQICRISSNRDQYADVDLPRNFTMLVADLSKKA